jgi:hypothetical protein
LKNVIVNLLVFSCLIFVTPQCLAETIDNDTALWYEVKSTNLIEDYKAYISEFPNGKFVVLAQNRINKLQALTPSESINASNNVLPSSGKGHIGVGIQEVTHELAESFGLPNLAGALISEVAKDGPADNAGIQVSDVILKFNGNVVNTSNNLPGIVGATRPGSKVIVELWRNGKAHEVWVWVGELAEIEGVIAIAKQNNIPVENSVEAAPSNLSQTSEITAPTPIFGNSGNYMSPFTASGNIANWAVKRVAQTDNGSDAAGAVGGYVGKQAADKALSFIPFGLGGMFGSNAGDAAGRAATRKTIEPALPTPYEAKANSDISFDTVDELAVYMYAKYSSHSEYVRVLELAEQVYPELRNSYSSAIEKASKAAVAQVASSRIEKENSNDGKRPGSE